MVPLFANHGGRDGRGRDQLAVRRVGGSLVSDGNKAVDRKTRKNGARVGGDDLFGAAMGLVAETWHVSFDGATGDRFATVQVLPIGPGAKNRGNDLVVTDNPLGATGNGVAGRRRQAVPPVSGVFPEVGNVGTSVAEQETAAGGELAEISGPGQATGDPKASGFFDEVGDVGIMRRPDKVDKVINAVALNHLGAN